MLQEECIKVAQLAGSVAEVSVYHHGEVGYWIPEIDLFNHPVFIAKSNGNHCQSGLRTMLAATTLICCNQLANLA